MESQLLRRLKLGEPEFKASLGYRVKGRRRGERGVLEGSSIRKGLAAQARI